MSHDLMLDLETMGTRAGCQIVSIGAVTFDSTRIGSKAYFVCKLGNQKIDYGLKVDQATETWWALQSEAARAVFRDPAALDLKTALVQFQVWYSQHMRHGVRIWSHGASFDPPILEHALRACGMVPPWSYHNLRDTRTLFDLAGIDIRRYRKANHHNAEADCLAQIAAVQDALRILQRSTVPMEGVVA
jgi:hypothetical protein